MCSSDLSMPVTKIIETDGLAKEDRTGSPINSGLDADTLSKIKERLMAVQIYGWERRLIDLAHEALEGQIAAARQIMHDDRAMSAAYAHCQQVTREHSRTFFLASGLLPKEKRRSARALYAFCRVCDDIVDKQQTSSNPTAELARWRGQPQQANTDSADPVAIAWADTRARFSIPWRYAEQLIEGVSQDLSQVRYPTALLFTTTIFAGLLDKKVEFSSLPVKVQETIKQQAEGGKIESIEQEKMKKEVIVYEVEVKRPDGKEYEFKVDENGVILELEKD